MNAANRGGRGFSPQAYRELILGFRKRGYEVKGFADADPKARHLIVRHDVDFSLAAARSMAEMESDLGLASTYFILLRTEFYNPMSAEGNIALSHILDGGHGVGLHFDAALYPQDRDSLNAAVEQECRILESIISRQVSTMSFHRPVPDRVGDTDVWAGRKNAYGPRFIKDMGYCSDSRGDWHHGPPFDHPAVRDGRALQLLTHPFWWMTPSRPPTERLTRFLDERNVFLDRELAKHCTIHKPRSE